MTPPGGRNTAGDVLSRRALNRALLARQLLLERSERPVPNAVEHLVGLQAQVPITPYIGLWTRLQDFDPTTLSDLLRQRWAVRAAVMRSTLHLLSARDLVGLQPVMGDVLARTFASTSYR